MLHFARSTVCKLSVPHIYEVIGILNICMYVYFAVVVHLFMFKFMVEAHDDDRTNEH